VVVYRLCVDRVMLDVFTGITHHYHCPTLITTVAAQHPHLVQVLDICQLHRLLVCSNHLYTHTQNIHIAK
jgi:hypothetical protein